MSEEIIRYTTLPRRVFSAIVFPVTLLGALALCLAGLHAGYAPEMVALVLSISVGVWVLALERLHPHARLWQRSHGDVPTDALHMALSQMMPPQVFNLLFLSGLTAASVWLAGAWGGTVWPADWPWLAQLALLLVLGEFFHYWWHRSCHEVPLLWRVHATHHSAERLYFLNAGRFHPLDSLTAYAIQAGPALLLGAPPELMALFGLYTAVHGLFQHGNIDVRLGPLNYVFSMAELHRWHHSRDVNDANANYGGNIILWDLVFGTRHLPQDREHAPDDVGIDMPQFPKRYLGQLLSPFLWNRLKAQEKQGESAGA